MMYSIIIANKKKFAKDISKLSSKERDHIFSKLSQLKEKGIQHTQVKQLHNYPLADYRLRTGSYRVLFDHDITSKSIIIYRILHRSKLY